MTETIMEFILGASFALILIYGIIFITLGKEGIITLNLAIFGDDKND